MNKVSFGCKGIVFRTSLSAPHLIESDEEFLEGYEGNPPVVEPAAEVGILRVGDDIRVCTPSLRKCKCGACYLSAQRKQLVRVSYIGDREC